MKNAIEKFNEKQDNNRLVKEVFSSLCYILIIFFMTCLVFGG